MNMIVEELKKIKAFGSNIEGSLTKEDIEKKEKELGIVLPESLCDLYRMFSPHDPIFSVWLNLVPFEELTTRVIERHAKIEYTCVTILKNEETSYGFVVKYRNLNIGEIVDYTLKDDLPFCLYYSNPKKRVDKAYLRWRNDILSSSIICYLGFLQVYSQPYLIAASKNIGKRANQHCSDMELWKAFNSIVKKQKCEVIALDSETKTEIIAAKHEICPFAMAKYGHAFGAQTRAPLEKLIEENPDFEFVWLKNNAAQNESLEREMPILKERQLVSIAPVLQFLLEFAGLSGKTATKGKIQICELKIKGKLPEPLKEYYSYLPLSFYHAYNELYPLSKLKLKKDGKIEFLEENQAVYHCAVERNSPFVYHRVEEGDEWRPWGILDGFLAGELAWNILACSEDLELDLEMWQFEQFEEEMLEEGGLLYPHLSDIAGISQQIAEGNIIQLYQALDGNVLCLYNKVTPEFYFMVKPESSDQWRSILGYSLGDDE